VFLIVSLYKHGREIVYLFYDSFLFIFSLKHSKQLPFLVAVVILELYSKAYRLPFFGIYAIFLGFMGFFWDL